MCVMAMSIKFTIYKEQHTVAVVYKSLNLHVLQVPNSFELYSIVSKLLVEQTRGVEVVEGC